MFLLLTQILLWLLVIAIVFGILDKSGGDQSLVVRLIALLFLVFWGLAFFAPNSPVGGAILSVVSFVLKPLGLSIVLLIAATAGIKKNGISNQGRSQLLAGLVILIVCSTPFIAYWLAEQAETEALKAIRDDTCCRGNPGVIVVLGQGTTEPNLPSRNQIQLTSTGNLISKTAQVYRTLARRGGSPIVIVSAGPRLNVEGHISEAEDIKKLLVLFMGVSSDDIIIEKQGIDLRTSAEGVKRILDSRGLGNRVNLVISALQVRRASLTFAKIGVKVVPIPTNFLSFPLSGKARRITGGADFVPSAEALLVTTRVVDEYLSSLYYLLRGWLAPAI